MKTFGENLNEARASARLTKSELADKANVSRSYLYELESGAVKEPSVYIALRLAEVLCVSVEFLAHGTPTTPQERELSQLRQQLRQIAAIASGQETVI